MYRWTKTKPAWCNSNNSRRWWVPASIILTTITRNKIDPKWCSTWVCPRLISKNKTLRQLPTTSVFVNKLLRTVDHPCCNYPFCRRQLLIEDKSSLSMPLVCLVNSKVREKKRCLEQLMMDSLTLVRFSTQTSNRQWWVADDPKSWTIFLFPSEKKSRQITIMAVSSTSNTTYRATSSSLRTYVSALVFSGSSTSSCPASLVISLTQKCPALLEVSPSSSRICLQVLEMRTFL